MNEETNQNKKKILIIEDEKILLKALNVEILKAGFEVYSAYDGLAGLEAAQELKPDLILLDLVLPKMDGFEFIFELRRNPEIKNTPIIVLSNLGQMSDVKKALMLGANDFFVKTDVDLNTIVTHIKKVLSNIKDDSKMA